MENSTDFAVRKKIRENRRKLSGYSVIFLCSDDIYLFMHVLQFRRKTEGSAPPPLCSERVGEEMNHFEVMVS